MNDNRQFIVATRETWRMAGSSQRIIPGSDSPMKACKVSISLFRRLMLETLLRSIPRNSIFTCFRCVSAHTQRYLRRNPDCDGTRLLSARFAKKRIIDSVSLSTESKARMSFADAACDVRLQLERVDVISYVRMRLRFSVRIPIRQTE